MPTHGSCISIIFLAWIGTQSMHGKTGQISRYIFVWRTNGRPPLKNHSAFADSDESSVSYTTIVTLKSQANERLTLRRKYRLLHCSNYLESWIKINHMVKDELGLNSLARSSQPFTFFDKWNFAMLFALSICHATLDRRQDEPSTSVRSSVGLEKYASWAFTRYRALLGINMADYSFVSKQSWAFAFASFHFTIRGFLNIGIQLHCYWLHSYHDVRSY